MNTKVFSSEISVTLLYRSWKGFPQDCWYFYEIGCPKYPVGAKYGSSEKLVSSSKASLAGFNLFAIRSRGTRLRRVYDLIQ